MSVTIGLCRASASHPISHWRSCQGIQSKGQDLSEGGLCATPKKVTGLSLISNLHQIVWNRRLHFARHPLSALQIVSPRLQVSVVSKLRPDLNTRAKSSHATKVAGLLLELWYTMHIMLASKRSTLAPPYSSPWH